MERLKEQLGDFIKLFSILAITSLTAGFIIWNLYLVKLGFYEFNVIQARYIHAGILFLLLTTSTIVLLYIIFSIIKWLFNLLPQDIIKWLKKLLKFTYFSFILPSIVLFWIISYTYLIFPRISQAFGGAQPRVLAIIATEPNIEYLKKLEIPVDNSRIITGNLCVAYENEEVVIILLEHRIVSFNKNLIEGFNSLPAKTRDEMASTCSILSMNWLLNTAEWRQ